ncbi:hypothetical protein [Streptomyces sp. NPDC058045]|uniref:hypothetical protein n=1 Tax=Streptomyces sp. NPDC058045 TaxID=3346311 RepID=UPI0036E69AB1
MSVDPSDPETFDEAYPDSARDRAEDTEAPEADAAEQHTEVAARQTEVRNEHGDPDTADEGDRAEQARVVELDEDDYR